jgi:four helix bundle protein
LSRNLYRDLLIWQKSMELVKEVYRLSESLPKSEDYNLKQQLKRAVVSLSLNIAEGKNRKTSKDFANFLSISTGSLAEVEAILVICNELGYLNNIDDTYEQIEILGKMINSLRSKLQYAKPQNC